MHSTSYFSFVSYDHLSPIARAFITKVSNVEISWDIEEALKVPEWKQIVLGEMLALEKNECGRL